VNPDPYKILGVARTASAEEIKKAYRERVKALHPDLHPGDAAKAEEFKRVSGAFDILGDADKRARFDRGEIDGAGNERAPFGAGAGDAPGAGYGYGTGPGGFRAETGSGGMHGDPFDDILSGLFGGGGRTRRRTGPVKGRDVRYNVEIAFADAVSGARRRLTMADGATLEVDIPAGISDGQTLRLKSQGELSPSGGPPGDALLKVSIRPSETWTREGHNLRMTQPVTLETAVLGGQVQVPTPSGPVTLKVPAGSNTGSTLRLKGKGVQLASAPGDLYVRLEIHLDDPKDAGLKDYLSKAARG